MSDVKRQIRELKIRGYFRQGTTFYDVSMPQVLQLTKSWRTYVCTVPDSEKIHARDDETAWEAFRTLYDGKFKVFEKITTYRKVPVPRRLK